MAPKVLVYASAVWVLAGCAGTRTLYSEDQPRTRGYSLAFVEAPNPTAPKVFIVGSKIVVDQEPIRPVVNVGEPVAIFFTLAEGGGFSFPPHGIEIVGHQNFCNPGESPYVFVCVYRRPSPDTVYKYAIRVKNDATGERLRDLDPTIWN